MSWRPLTDLVVSLVPDGVFDVVVTGDAVGHGKPHPEPYLTAARLLGVDAASCVAIEDSPAGVASAVAAGVPTHRRARTSFRCPGWRAPCSSRRCAASGPRTCSSRSLPPGAPLG